MIFLFFFVQGSQIISSAKINPRGHESERIGYLFVKFTFGCDIKITQLDKHSVFVFCILMRSLTTKLYFSALRGSQESYTTGWGVEGLGCSLV